KRSATPSISSVETHQATKRSPERETFEIHLPMGLDSASTGSTTARSSTYSWPKGTILFPVPHPGCRPPGRDPRPNSFRIRVPAASRSGTARTTWSSRSIRPPPPKATRVELAEAARHDSMSRLARHGPPLAPLPRRVRVRRDDPFAARGAAIGGAGGHGPRLPHEHGVRPGRADLLHGEGDRQRPHHPGRTGAARAVCPRLR